MQALEGVTDNYAAATKALDLLTLNCIFIAIMFLHNDNEMNRNKASWLNTKLLSEKVLLVFKWFKWFKLRNHNQIVHYINIEDHDSQILMILFFHLYSIYETKKLLGLILHALTYVYFNSLQKRSHYTFALELTSR